MLVPLRFIAESIGAVVSWDQKTQTAAIIINGSTVKVTVNSTKMSVDGKTITLDVPAAITGSRTFVPLRAVSEALGKKVLYDRGLVVISDTDNIFDTVNEKQAIDGIISTVNILPTVNSREKLVGMLGVYGGGSIAYDEAKTMMPAENAASAPAPAAAQAADSGASQESSPEYSKTNIQVEGVDEADIVKTDGEYIYQVSNQNVLIYKAYPADEMKLSGSISYSDGQFMPVELYVKGDLLVVIGQTSFNEVVPVPATELKGPVFYPGYNDSATKAIVYDVSDRGNPKSIRQVSLQGYYVSSRLIGNDLYLVSNQNLYYRQDDTSPLNPQYLDTAVSTENISIPYTDIKYMPPVVNSSYLMVAGLSLDEPKKPLSVEAYLGAGDEIYVSQNNLYVSVNEGYGGIRPMWMMEDTMMPTQIQEATLVYKFALEDGTATYQARGQVPGRILNQFSMDESSDTFRIATTTQNSWMTNDSMSNNVFVLDGSMNVTGKLTDIAKGEKIYSVRFMGDRAYVVTFKTIDPLFVIDLKDPSNPEVLGALKIPGYSDYLQPYDENHIIGFGKDAITVPNKDGSGKVVSTSSYYLGMKVALFDVSDVSNPVEKFSVKNRRPRNGFGAFV